MVWGMSSLFGFGDFWPNGDFEYDRRTKESGWYTRLKEFYKKQTPEEQKRLFDYKGDIGNRAHFYSTFPSAKFLNERGAIDEGVRLDELEPFEVPRSWDTIRTHQNLGSLIKLESKILAVDEPLKNIIERVEPEVHGFYELPIRMPGGTEYPVRFFILRVGQYFDAFSRKDSWEGSVEQSETAPHLLHLNDTKKGISGLAFVKTVFGNAHLWRDRQVGFQDKLTCFSDELIAEINQAGLRLPKRYKMREV